MIVMDKRTYSILEVSPVGDTSRPVVVRVGNVGKQGVESLGDTVLLVTIVGLAIVSYSGNTTTQGCY